MIDAKKPHGGARPGSGRPPMPGGPLVKVTHRITPAQRDKLVRLGGSEWLRQAIDSYPGINNVQPISED